MLPRMNNIIEHPTSVAAKEGEATDRHNLARQLRTTQMMREQAREQINPTEIITQLIEIDVELQGETHIQSGMKIPMERETIAQLRARADIKFRLLSKVLPDLKSTESVSYSAHDHQHLHAHGDLAAVSNMELAQRLQLWRRDHLNEISTAELTVPAPLGPTSPELKVASEQPPTSNIEDFL